MELVKGIFDDAGQRLLATLVDAQVLVEEMHSATVDVLERGLAGELQADGVGAGLLRVRLDPVEGEEHGAVAAEKLIDRVCVAMCVL